MANTGFVNQFTTGRPYVNPTVAIARPQFNIKMPRLPEGDDPTEDPTKTKDPTSNPDTKPISNPKSTGHGIWGTIGKDIGIGAGVAATVGGAVLGASGLKGAGSTVSKTLDLGKEGLELGEQGIVEGADPIIHSAPSIGRNLLNWGEDAGGAIESAAKGANSFLESTSNGGGLVQATQGTGKFSPAGDAPPETGGLKMPDSWGNAAEDVGSLLKGDFSLAA